MKQMLPYFRRSIKKYCASLLLLAIAAMPLFAQNANNGGTVAANQSVCPGEVPNLFTSVTPASGGNVNLPIQYMWMTTTDITNTNIQSWTPASGVNNQADYQPPSVGTTTYFARCARRQGFADFVAESNIITVSILSTPTAIINGNPGNGYVGTSVNLSASFSSNSTYSWDLDGNGTNDAFGQNASFTYNTPGTYNITLTVNNGQCSVTTTSQIVIENPSIANISDPCNCDNPFNIVDGPNLAYYNHDYVLINSNAGETWTITSISGIGGGIFNQNLQAIPVGTQIPETGSGVYYINIWFNGVQGGWSLTVQNNNGITLSTGPGAITPCPICPDSPLPVELSSFEGQEMDKGIELTWVTQSEKDNSHFEIESSTNGVDFTRIGKVDGIGFSNETIVYNFIDENPAAGKNYYRLKQSDFDGTYVYSNVIVITAKNVSTEVSISPNPVQETARVQLEIVQPNSMIQIISNTGQVVKEYPVNDLVEEIFMGDLPSGVYFFRLISNSSTINLYQKVIKQ